MSSIVSTSESGLGQASNVGKSISVSNGMSMSTSGTWLKICAVNEIPVLGSRRVARQQGIDVAVFRNDHDEVFALLDRCPHKGGPLSQGIVFGKHVACPLHNWAIALSDGKARAPDEGCTPQFKLKVENGFVFLDALELENHAIDLPKPLAGPILRDSVKSS